MPFSEEALCTCVQRPKTKMVCGVLYSQSVNLLGLPLCRPCSTDRKVNWILTVKVVVPGENIHRGGVDEETKGRIGSVLEGDLIKGVS